MDFVIISGLSGSGKSTALRVLEDQGYYCVDNLPATLLSAFGEQLLHQAGSAQVQAAASIDVRNREFLGALPAELEALHRQGIRPRILFLEADEAELIKRFSETRRRHPLTDARSEDRSEFVRALVEGLRLEREMVQPLSQAASKRMDTSRINTHQLRTRVQAWSLAGRSHSGLVVLLQSFGFKEGVPLDSDFVFDLRGLPNPHYEPELRPLTGQDRAVVEFLAAQPTVQAMYADLRGFFERWLPVFEQESRSYVTISIGCTGGQHRSVYFTERLARDMRAPGRKVLVHHRELAQVGVIS